MPWESRCCLLAVGQYITDFFLIEKLLSELLLFLSSTARPSFSPTFTPSLTPTFTLLSVFRSFFFLAISLLVIMMIGSSLSRSGVGACGSDLSIVHAHWGELWLAFMLLDQLVQQQPYIYRQRRRFEQ
jgi:hypothetical protein